VSSTSPVARPRDIENVYPLSPMQQGMLFHSLFAPQAKLYLQQIGCTIEGQLDVSAFERAWQRVVERHSILRTEFVWEGLERPLQIVRKRARLPFEVQDLRSLSPEAQHLRLAELTSTDVDRGIDLSRAPVLRIALVRLADDAYRCIWTFHHIVLDGWSMPLVMKEVFTTYRAFARGEDVRLERARPFGDYIAWLTRQDVGRAQEFWSNAIGGFSVPTSLRIDHAAPVTPTTTPSLGLTAIADSGGAGEQEYHERELTLPEVVSEAAHAFARAHQVTANTLVQGAWALLLGRYSGEDDVLFGATVSGRPPAVPGIEAMVGSMINTLPVRVRLPAEAKVGAWLRSLQGQQAELREVEHSPLAEVQRWSSVPAGTPLFDTLLVFENYPIEESVTPASSGLSIRDVTVRERTNYPLVVKSSFRKALYVSIGYASPRYEDADVERMLGHLAVLLAAMVHGPDTPLGELPLLTEAERRTLLVEWNDTRAFVPEGACVHELFEEQVRRTPDAVAVADETSELTYAELNRRANQLAHALTDQGVGPEVLVGVCLDRSALLIVALLGVLKAGGAYVPLNTSYPEERLGFMLADAGVRLLLTEARVLAGLGHTFLDGARGGESPRAPSEPSVKTLCLDTDTTWMDAAATFDLPRRARPDNLAYMIYTSGSTGVPKGVELGHAGLVNLVTWHQRTYRLHAGDRATQLAMQGFDASVWEIWPHLACGASVHVPDDETRGSPAKLVAWLAARRITSTFLPTPLAEAVIEEPWPRETALLRMLTGGDLLHRPPRPQIPFGLVNHYGPTEATVVATSTAVPASLDGAAPPIGRPIANSEAFLLGPTLAPVPISVPGELFVGGAGLARGYHSRPDLTAERFVPSPFSTVGGARLYRTGDLGRYRPDGSIDFLGRIDRQVKIRGFRIELGEVEAVLAAHPQVSEAAVTTRPDAAGEGRMVGYVVPEEGAAPSAGELLEHLAKKLPDYMLPVAIVLLAAMPMTPNGKIDVRALPSPEMSHTAKGDPAAPRTPVEDVLAGIFADVLGAARVGIHDSFFGLGGHSLTATRAVSRIRSAFQIELPLRGLFESPTVATLAALVEAGMRAGGGLHAPPITKAPPGEEIALSFAEERLWFLDQLQPGNPSYIIPGAVRLEGRLDTEALTAAVEAVVRRHEALRTRFETLEGRPRRVVETDARIPIPITDWIGLPRLEQDEAIRREVAEEARRPFDLGKGPLLRLRLLRLGDEEHVLLLAVHHIVSDGWSMGILVREIGVLYDVISRGAASPLPSLPIQYADYACWQRKWMSGEVLEGELLYWREQLRGAPGAIDLPLDRPRPAVQTFAGAQHGFRVSPATSAALLTLGRREGVTLFMTLLAAFDILLSRSSRQGDLVVGTPIANRTHAETEPLIGCFINTLVLRARLDEGPSFRELLGQVREVSLGAYAHQEVPFERLVDDLSPERDLSRTPLFQVMFILQNTPAAEVKLPGLALRGVDASSRSAKFELTLSMSGGEAGLGGSFEYNTDLFDATTIERMTGHLQILLEGAVADPEARVWQLPMLSAAEREALVITWNSTSAPIPEGVCLHQLFEVQARRSPDATAVMFEGTTLSYLELDRRSNQLAHALRARGVGPDVLVAVCMDRSIELLVALFGVLKAGGAYVPVDPTYPKERIAFFLQDSRAPVLLTQEHLLSDLPPHGARSLCLDATFAAVAAEPTTAPKGTVRPANLAYMIYTSGSTGQPKGAMNTHGAIVNRLLWMQRAYGLTAADSVLQKTPFSFDVSVWELFWPLLNGARLVVARPDGHRDGADLTGLIAAQSITAIHFVPSMLEAFLEEPDLARCRSLRLVVCSGEALAPSLQQRFFERLDAAALHNLYGPTEAAVDVTSWACERRGRGRTVPIGRPVDNTRIHVLDRHLSPTPVGVAGELYIGGVQLARGYLGRPGLTADTFVPDPFARDAADGSGSSAGPGARLYRTGDLARVRPDGAIEYLARLDHQVKVRGFRIELGEIEAALRQQPSVREAVVVARDEPPGRKRLVAYLVAAEAPAFSLDDLRTALRAQLPEFMVPAAFVVLEKLPLTPSGKVDRRALPAPEGPGPEIEAGYVAPRRHIEEVLARVWATVLRVPKVGVHDNYFALGGDSVLSIQIVALAGREGIRLTPKQLFQHQTVAELAQAAADAAGAEGHDGGAADAGPRAEQGLVTGPVALVPIQRWFFEQDLADAHHFNQSLMLEVRVPLVPALLSQVLEQVLLHHDALRTRFSRGESGFQAIIAEPGPAVPFRTIDLVGVPRGASEAAIEKTAAETQASLRLDEGPLFRVVLFNLGPGRPGRLLFVAHHLVVDGVSWRVLLDDLWTGYEALRRGEPLRLPPKTTSLKAWADRLIAHARSDEVARELELWMAGQEDVPPPLPVDHPGGRNVKSSARTVMAALDPEETQRLLRDVPEAYRSQINDVLLTALVRAFARWTGSRSLLVALEGHGREEIFPDVDLTRTVGWFTTLFPVLLDPGGSPDPGAMLMAVKEALRRIPNRGIGYGLLRYLGDEPIAAALRALPEPEVSFNYLGQLDQAVPAGAPFQGARESTGGDQSPQGARRYAIDVVARVAGGRMQVGFTYSEHLHDRATIEVVAQAFLEALRVLIEHATSAGAGGYTPSDFGAVSLSTAALDSVVAKLKRSGLVG
jgi:amino acid adenylation domain-containing protein/non-ribosomal peptide synthase protein (TIGR01720 family)